jgi:hypothetical protein
MTSKFTSHAIFYAKYARVRWMGSKPETSCLVRIFLTISPTYRLWLRKICFLFELTHGGPFSTGWKHKPVRYQPVLIWGEALVLGKNTSRYQLYIFQFLAFGTICLLNITKNSDQKVPGSSNKQGLSHGNRVLWAITKNQIDSLLLCIGWRHGFAYRSDCLKALLGRGRESLEWITIMDLAISKWRDTLLKAVGAHSLRGRGGELGKFKTLTYGSN